MLHADRFEDFRREPLYSLEAKRTTVSQRSSNQSDASDLDALLSENLTPNKRAVVQALVQAWETNHRANLKHTG